VDIFSVLLVVGLIGIAAQFVDGSLGMGYGVTSATLLATIGYSPAAASATIHVAKIGTGVASGAAHWRFGNVHWRAVVMLAVPGAIGAFVGAFALSYIAAEVTRPWVSLVLAALGVLVIARTVLRRSPAIRVYTPRLRSLGPLGLVGGFIDSIGGGGWGPVTTSSLMAANRMAPNQVIGTVSTAEIVVALSASLGFLLALGSQGIAWGAMAALLLGGLVAAPFAAWAVSRLDHRVLGGLVGGMILFYNAEGVLALAGLGDQSVMVARVLIVIGTLALTIVAWRDRSVAQADVADTSDRGLAEPAPSAAA
jgi:hypothetical protein